MSITIRSSTVPNLSDPVLREALTPDHGQAVELIELGVVVVRPEDIYALADQRADEEEQEQMSSFGKRTTGIENTIFISPNVTGRHGPRIKVAIDPPPAFKPGGKDASISIADGSLVRGEMPPGLLKQVQLFIETNRAALLAYWNYEILTDEMEARLKKV